VLTQDVVSCRDTNDACGNFREYWHTWDMNDGMHQWIDEVLPYCKGLCSHKN
jgi:hypothetical protein